MFWQPKADQAVALQLGELCATIDLARPGDGLTNLKVAGQPLAGACLLGVATASLDDAHAIENYIRGTDLIVAYEEPKRQSARVDVLWRAIAPTASDDFLAALDVIVSVRTQSLDSWPELPVQSAVPYGEVLRLRSLGHASYTPLAVTTDAPVTLSPEGGAGCLLFRVPGQDLSYCEMIHAADFQHDELRRLSTLASTGADRKLVERGIGDDGGSCADALHLAHRLFHTHLEKGVILRARVRAVFLPRDGDTEISARCYAAFASAEPLLGT